MISHSHGVCSHKISEQIQIGKEESEEESERPRENDIAVCLGRKYVTMV